MVAAFAGACGNRKGLAQQGFVVLKVDNRGSANRGLRFEGAIQRDMGRADSPLHPIVSQLADTCTMEWVYQYYSREQLATREARRGWISPVRNDSADLFSADGADKK